MVDLKELLLGTNCQINLIFQFVYEIFWYIGFSVDTFPLVVKWALISGGSPFQWDDQENKIFPASTKTHLWRWKFYVFLWTGYVAYLLTLLLMILLKVGYYHHYDINVVLSAIFLAIPPTIIQWNILWKIKEFQQFVNSCLLFCKNHGQNFSQNTNAALEKIQLFLEVLLALSVLFPLCSTLVYAFKPSGNPSMASSILPEELTGLFSVLLCILTIGVWSLPIFYITSGLYFYICILHYTTMLKCKRFTKRRKKGFTLYDDLCKNFRSLQVLSNMYSAFSKDFLMPLHVFIATIIIYIAYNARMYYFNYLTSEILYLTHFPLMLFIIFWIVSLHFGGRISKHTSSSIISWKNRFSTKYWKETLVLRKFQKSSPPVQIQVGFLYCVSHKSILQLIFKISHSFIIALIGINILIKKNS